VKPTRGPAAADIIVVGSANLDHVLAVPRLPAPGETVAASDETTTTGGKGANQAVAAAALGGRVALVGVVGGDAEGRKARSSLRSAGVDVTYLGRGSARTGAATVMVDGSGENMIVVRAGANDELSADDVRRAIHALGSVHSLVLASLEVPLSAVLAAADVAGEIGARFVLNTAPARELPADLLAKCDVVVPNEVELAQLGGAAEDILARGARALVVTRGGRGVEVYVPGGKPIAVPAPEVEVRDTTGAGDVFVAALSTALQEGTHLEDACRFAAAAGALATTRLGARGMVPRREEIEALLD